MEQLQAKIEQKYKVLEKKDIFVLEMRCLFYFIEKDQQIDLIFVANFWNNPRYDHIYTHWENILSQKSFGLLTDTNDNYVIQRSNYILGLLPSVLFYGIVHAGCIVQNYDQSDYTGIENPELREIFDKHMNGKSNLGSKQVKWQLNFDFQTFEV